MDGPIPMSARSVHQFAEKVALVSDAASPIGRAVSMQLALNGCFVIGLFPNGSADGDSSLNELVELGTLAHSFNIDPSNASGAAAAAAEVSRVYGRLDLLVNCLKYTSESPFQSIGESEVLDVLRRNIGSAAFLTQGVFGLMNERPRPKIVNIASVGQEIADPVFAASQAGIISLTDSLAKSFPTHFRINCVAVNDEPNSSQSEDGLNLRQGMKNAPDDVARTVLFLLSSESILMNGKTVRLG